MWNQLLRLVSTRSEKESHGSSEEGLKGFLDAPNVFVTEKDCELLLSSWVKKKKKKKLVNV